MRKFTFLLLAALFVMGFTACQADKKGEATGTDGTATVETTAEKGPAEITPPESQATARPEWQEKADALPKTTVEFDNQEFNYGTVTAGEVVSHKFTFKNTGDQPLTLTRVKASCGCTTPSYSQEPIAPGATGYIDVKFDSSGKSGRQNKSVTVTGNFSDNITQVLRISGEVKAE
jgi:hypothetical protein